MLTPLSATASRQEHNHPPRQRARPKPAHQAGATHLRSASMWTTQSRNCFPGKRQPRQHAVIAKPLEGSAIMRPRARKIGDERQRPSCCIATRFDTASARAPREFAPSAPITREALSTRPSASVSRFTVLLDFQRSRRRWTQYRNVRLPRRRLPQLHCQASTFDNPRQSIEAGLIGGKGQRTASVSRDSHALDALQAIMRQMLPGAAAPQKLNAGLRNRVPAHTSQPSATRGAARSTSATR